MGVAIDQAACTSCGVEVDSNHLQCEACVAVLQVMRPVPRHGETGPVEPCVNCDSEAAVNWLLCLKCAAVIDEEMLIKLAKKHGEYERWLVAAEDVLREIPKEDPRFVAGWKIWQRKLRVYERLAWLSQSVRSAS